MKTRNLVVSIWLGICLTVLTVGAAAEALPTRTGVVALDIKSQPIGAALNELAQQAGIQVLFFADVATDLRAPALAGTFTPDVALTQLLSNTGLTYSYVNARTVAIHRVADKVSERKATRKEAGRPVMRLANYEQVSAEPKNEAVRETGSQEVRRQNSSEERRKTRMEEIIVTATKRAENIQDVPLSLTAISADEIDRRGLVSAADYLRGIPGVNQSEGAFGQSITIRGIESSLYYQNFFTGTTVATYFGETPTTNTAGTGGGTNVDVKLVDIERVEVLRGPQGTAFGSSSMGGTVRTIPVAPNLDQFEGKVAASYSVTSGFGSDNNMIQGVGNIPLIQDKLAIRATAYQFHDSGLYRNRAASDAAFQTAVVIPHGVQAFVRDTDDIGSYYAVGGRVAALFQASDDLKFTLTYISQKNETDGIPVANSGTYEQTVLQLPPQHVGRGQDLGRSDLKIDIANAMMEYSFGWANLLATYSHTQSGSKVAYQHTVGNIQPSSNYADSDHRENVGEIRLATQLDGAWNVLGGVYAEELKDNATFDNLWYGDPARNPFGPNPAIGFRDDRRTLKQKAAFGEVSWEFAKGLTLTGGVRAYQFDRTFHVDTIGRAYNGAALANTHVVNDRATDASGEIYRANLSYKPSDDALLYASFSQGFRLGQAQLGLPPGSCDLNSDGIVDGTGITIESTRRINSDEVDSFELGSKFELLDRRLTIAADVFHTEWSGMPVNFAPGSGVCVLSYLANAGAALSDGVEFQASFQIAEPLRVDFSGSWIRARLDEDVPALRASKGNRLPGSPKVNASLGLQYEFKIGGYKTFVRADSVYVGSFYGDLRESPATEAGDYVKLDASAGVRIGNLNIDLFARNLTDEDAFTFRNLVQGAAAAMRQEFFGYRLRPRTIGLELGYTF